MIVSLFLTIKVCKPDPRLGRVSSRSNRLQKYNKRDRPSNGRVEADLIDFLLLDGAGLFHVLA